MSDIDKLVATIALLNSQDVPSEGRHIMISADHYENITGEKPEYTVEVINGVTVHVIDQNWCP